MVISIINLINVSSVVIAASSVFAAYLPASMYPCKNTEGQGCALPALGFPHRHAKGQEAPGMETFISSMKLVMPSNVL